MKDIAITIPVKIDARLFRDFAMFDIIRMKRRLRSPIIFALIMLAFAIVCFARFQTSWQAVLLGSVLLAIGLGLPAVYFVNFIGSINAQIVKLGLTAPQPVYTVTFTEAPDGIKVVTRNGDASQYEWDSVYGVYRGKDCTYLYVQSTRAYLLPDKDVGKQTEALNGLLKKRVANSKGIG